MTAPSDRECVRDTSRHCRRASFACTGDVVGLLCVCTYAPHGTLPAIWGELVTNASTAHTDLLSYIASTQPELSQSSSIRSVFPRYGLQHITISSTSILCVAKLSAAVLDRIQFCAKMEGFVAFGCQSEIPTIGESRSKSSECPKPSMDVFLFCPLTLVVSR